MNARAQIAALPDGRRHFHDGPMDLILGASGERAQVERAYAAGADRFVTILDELCSELPLLRAAARPDAPRPRGAVAARMFVAVEPFQTRRFVTPMAAVAGAVAEEVLQAMTDAAVLTRAFVNNGGDIAMHLTRYACFAVGMVERPDRLGLFGRATITGEDCVRGIATSGWRGRSFSLGIADAVTVIARTASLADAAATLIANAVDCPGHPAIRRAPACARDPQSDLGERLVTIEVGALGAGDIEAALGAGAAEAEAFRRAGLIEAAALRLQAQTRLVGVSDRLYKRERDAPPQTKVRHAAG